MVNDRVMVNGLIALIKVGGSWLWRRQPNKTITYCGILLRRSGRRNDRRSHDTATDCTVVGGEVGGSVGRLCSGARQRVELADEGDLRRGRHCLLSGWTRGARQLGESVRRRGGNGLWLRR